MVSNTISKSAATRAEWYLRGRSLLVQHEPCGFVRKGNAPERPGRRKLHNLGVPISKSSWVDRTRRKYNHPAQKAADPVRRPSSNRTRRATGDGQALETDGRTFTRGAEGNLRNRKRRCVCSPARSGEALPAAARLVQRLAVDRADDGFENLHSAPAPRNGSRSAKFRSAAFPLT